VNTGLLNEHKAYFVDVKAGQGPVGADQVADLLENVREIPAYSLRVHRKPHIWFAVAAAAAVLVVFGGLSLLNSARRCHNHIAGIDRR
jgi:hypothetical protein